ncbi:unnamed protein product, partial [Ectocarpus sp. 12 AP-2014]
MSPFVTPGRQATQPRTGSLYTLKIQSELRMSSGETVRNEGSHKLRLSVCEVLAHGESLEPKHVSCKSTSTQLLGLFCMGTADTQKTHIVSQSKTCVHNETEKIPYHVPGETNRMKHTPEHQIYKTR